MVLEDAKRRVNCMVKQYDIARLCKERTMKKIMPDERWVKGEIRKRWGVWGWLRAVEF